MDPHQPEHRVVELETATLGDKMRAFGHKLLSALEQEPLLERMLRTVAEQTGGTFTAGAPFKSASLVCDLGEDTTVVVTPFVAVGGNAFFIEGMDFRATLDNYSGLTGSATSCLISLLRKSEHTIKSSDLETFARVLEQSKVLDSGDDGIKKSIYVSPIKNNPGQVEIKLLYHGAPRKPQDVVDSLAKMGAFIKLLKYA